MPRKLAALIATAAVAVLVAGTLTVVALRNHHGSSSPRPTAVSLSAPPSSVVASTPTHTPRRTPTTPDLRRYGATATGKVIYLTFDDGPDPVWTPQVLRLLTKYGAKATFFQLGDMVTAHPGLQTRVRAAGHTIGSHSISHPLLTLVPSARRRHEIAGGPVSHCFRPPYGATNAQVSAEIRAAGMAEILWTVDPRDWDRPGAAAIAHRVLSRAHPGGIVLLHDGGGHRAQTVAALDRILKVLKRRGYSFPALTC